MQSGYRGRLAPSPTGFLHVGHACTFWMAQERAVSAGGILVLRNEDLDPSRSRQEFVAAMIEDLRWFGLRWQEGPDCGGPFGPYSQSERRDFHAQSFEKLKASGLVYRCHCSRQDVLRALQAPHTGEEEPVYPGTCRPTPSLKNSKKQAEDSKLVNWRFRVPDNEVIEFEDGCCGKQQFVAGMDFGDFVVWRHDGIPSYQPAVVADDAAMQITEVVRGADLLVSTARQLLLYRSLDLQPPAFFHCPLVTNKAGQRLAKRDAALSLRALRGQGFTPEAIRQTYGNILLK
jgi:glutamyl/glutaminyl-tRNA synthetase